jgi:DsbC/DsbD-like thiol-disulfide interchange protein
VKFAVKLSSCFLIFALGCSSAGDSQSESGSPTAEGASSGAGAGGEYVRATGPAPVDVEMELPEPSPSEPVSPGIALVPAQVRPGETVLLVVKAKIAPSWHIYAIDEPTGVSIPTSLKLTLPEGVVPEGKWQIPEPHEFEMTGSTADGPTFVYDGEVSFYRQLKVSPDSAGGQMSITCDFGYQACDAATCRPPKTLSIPATIDVLQ